MAWSLETGQLEEFRLDGVLGDHAVWDRFHRDRSKSPSIASVSGFPSEVTLDTYSLRFSCFGLIAAVFRAWTGAQLHGSTAELAVNVVLACHQERSTLAVLSDLNLRCFVVVNGIFYLRIDRRRWLIRWSTGYFVEVELFLSALSNLLKRLLTRLVMLLELLLFLVEKQSAENWSELLILWLLLELHWLYLKSKLFHALSAFCFTEFVEGINLPVIIQIPKIASLVLCLATKW